MTVEEPTFEEKQGEGGRNEEPGEVSARPSAVDSAGFDLGQITRGRNHPGVTLGLEQSTEIRFAGGKQQRCSGGGECLAV